MSQIVGEMFKRFEVALISAYPTPESLERLVRYELNENLDSIAHGENLRDVAYRLLRWAEANGRFHELIEKAYAQNSGNEHLTEFIKLYRASSRSVEVIEIPFVIFAMTHAESTELVEGRLFNNPRVGPIERERFDALNKAFNLSKILERYFNALNLGPAEDQHFDQLIDALKNYRIIELLQFYGETREAWQPPIVAPATIQATIEEVMALRNRQGKLGEPIIAPHFISERFFSDDTAVRERTWDQLRDSTCIFIIDALSMFHPLLLSKLKDSQLCSPGRNFVVVLSPMGANVLPVNRLLEHEMRANMALVFLSYADRLELRSEFSVGSIYGLKRWLLSILPETVAMLQGQKADPTATQWMRSTQGEPTGKKPFGFMRRGGE